MAGSGLINQAQIENSQIAFSTRFNMVLDAIDDPIRELSMELPSTAAVEEHDWLGTVPGLSEWIDDRKLGSLRADGFQIRNKDWANGVPIHANDLKDDRLGMVKGKLDSLAKKAGLHYGQLMIDALVQGFIAAGGGSYGPAYDGQSFFSASHKDGNGPTQSNTSGATALSQASYDAARIAMQALQDEDGDPLGIMPTHLVVGPSNERLALEITQAGVIGNPAGTASVTNVFAGTARVIVSQRLVGSSAGHWFLASFAEPVRGLILQINEPITSAFVIGDDASSGGQSYQRFMRKKMLFGAQGRHNVGYGMWQFIHGANA